MIDLIQELTDATSKPEVLKHIAKRSQDGLHTHHITSFLDLIFHTNKLVRLTITNKLYLIKHILIPKNDCSLPLELIPRIISHIGVAENGRLTQYLPVQLQVPILQWLITYLHLFGSKVYSHLNSYLPVLFNLLSFEYLRPQIANLIFITLLNWKSVKKWFVELVEDLHHKFPIDDSIRCLLLLFRTLGADINEVIDLESTNVFKIPETVSNNRLLRQNIRYYTSFNNRKRVKLHGAIEEDLKAIDFANGKNVPIRSINSINDLVSNFLEISGINLDNLLLPNEPLEQYYIVLKCISDEETYDKLDYYIRLSLFDDTLSDVEFGNLTANLLQMFSLSGNTIHFKLIDSFFLSKAGNIGDKIKLLRIFSGVLNISPLLQNLDESLFNQLVDNVITFWSINPNYNSISTTIIKLYEFAIDSDLDIVYLCIRLFTYIRSIQMADLNSHFSDEAVVPDPFFVYTLLLTNDPFIVSELCAYIAYIKNFQFKESHFKTLQNTYIMDLVNLLWRDKALYYDGSVNRALMFHPKFIENLDKLNTFNFDIKLNLIGNLFINPTWCFITSQVIWKIEDDNDVKERHDGPISRRSLEALIPTEKWLKLSYEDLKLRLLNELDNLGFRGLSDLLFSSLRTLQDKRDRTK